jgi:hypothetical protein
VVAVFAAAQVACVAGAHYDVRADSARYPISFSPVLLGPDDEFLALGHELEEVGSFELNHYRFGLVYSLVKFGPLDISDDINKEVISRRGEGVVSLSVTTSNCATNWFVPLTILPFWPGCQVSVITGVVVKRAPAVPKVEEL